MAYIGASPSNGVRRKHTYTATASQTTFSGAGAEGVSLNYRDSNYVDVYQNGVKLGDADYTATSGTSIVLGTGATVSDLIVIVAYDVFSVADTVSKADGGTFDGNVTMAGTLAVTGNETVGGTLGVTGAVTANAGVVVDNITIDGTEIDLSSGDLTIDVAGDIILDADGADVSFRDGGTGHLSISNSSNDAVITSLQNDKDMIFKGVDGGSVVTALTLDMSDAGTAVFNKNITVTDGSIASGVTHTFNLFGANGTGGNANYATYSFVGDPNTGMFSGTADTLKFATGGSERMRINANGQLLLGTTTSRGKLTIGVDSSSADGLYLDNANGGATMDLALLGSGYNAHGANAGEIWFYSPDNINIGGATGNTNSIKFLGGGAERMSIASNGRVRIGGTDQDGHLHVFGNFAGSGSSGYSAVFHNDGNNSNRFGILSKSGADDASGTNYAFEIQDGNGTLQGLITFSGGTVTYGAFTAYHPCIIPNADNDADSTANAYPYGTLLEITSLSYTQKNDADTERGIRYNVQKSSSAKSKAVLGAYGSSMNGGPENNTNMHQALILGDGHILCNNENGNIAVGDYICTSSASGEGMKATSICTTIGIAREAITFTDSTAVLVAVEYGYRQFVPEDLEARIEALENA